MDARRSFYFAPGQDARSCRGGSSSANCLDWDDIPFVAPANDNFRIKNRCRWGASLPRLMRLFGRTRTP